MVRVLHITPHLGCGVGRVLSQVANFRRAQGSGIEDVFICLERPEKMQFVDAITQRGGTVHIEPGEAQTQALLEAADIVQLEWWHHPRMAQWLHEHSGWRGLLAIWSHTSGLHYPSFPPGLAALPHVFMSTTAASPAGVPIPSSGGFDDVPVRREYNEAAPRFGYLGSLNAAKMHPQVMDYIAAAGDDFRLRVYGEKDASTPLRPSPAVELMGYTNDPFAALACMDVLVYLLSPLHYGTTENALLEAMAGGVVPVVFANAVERAIVKHGETGFVVDSPAAFAEVIAALTRDPQRRIRMAQAAAKDVRARYTLAATVAKLDAQYEIILRQEPKRFDFDAVFGATPFDWFRAGLGRYGSCFEGGAEERARDVRRTLPFLYERNKSSLFHFLRCFPDDMQLRHWARVLEDDHADRRRIG